MLEQMEGRLGENHSGAVAPGGGGNQSGADHGGGIGAVGVDGEELTERRKSDPDKLALAARLRRETTLSLRAIAARVHLGSSKSANALLHRWMREPANAPKGKPPHK